MGVGKREILGLFITPQVYARVLGVIIIQNCILLLHVTHFHIFLLPGTNTHLRFYHTY